MSGITTCKYKIRCYRKMKCLSLIFLYFFIVRYCETFEYIVVPTIGGDDDGCIDELEECHHLSYYTSQSDVYFTSDTTLTFLPGTHILDHDGPVVISDVSNLTLQGDGEIQDGINVLVRQSTVVISCNAGTNSGFLFRNFDDVAILGLTITNCGYVFSNDLVSYVSDRYFETRYNWNYTVGFPASLAILLLNGTNANIYELSLQNSTGYGLTFVNVYDIEISSSWFSRSNYNCKLNTRPFLFGGNIRIAYIDSTNCPEGVSPTSTVSLNTVYISYGSNCGVYNGFNKVYEEGVSQGGGGLAVMANSYQCSNVELDLRGVRAFLNRARVGSNILIMGLPIKTYINRLICSYGREGYFGSGLAVYVTQEPPVGLSPLFTIVNGLFLNNGFPTNTSYGIGAGSAFALNIYTNSFYTTVRLYFCEFRSNYGASTILVLNNIPTTSQSLNLILNLVVINGNVLNPIHSPGPFDGSGGIVLVNTHCSATRLHVVNNSFTGIELLDSVLQFNGDNYIQNNTDTNGGGMKLLRKSQINLFSPNSNQPPTRVYFENNHARESGGAIFVPVQTENDLTYDLPCFIQAFGSPDLNIMIIAVNNTAGITGEFLSGGNLGTCFITGDNPYSFANAAPNIFEAPFSSFHFLLSLINPPVNISENRYFLSSIAVGVFYCDSSNNEPLVVNNPTHPTIEVFQGKPFTIVVATISDSYGFAPGSITITVQNCSYSYSSCTDLPDQTFVRSIGNHCTNISLVVTGDSYSTLMHVRMNTATTIYTNISPNLFLNVISIDCPPGFTKSVTCECNDYIKELGGECDINDTTITLSGDGWVGYDSTSNSTLHTDDCPFDYCNNESITFNILDSPDRQCAYHRSGISCGGCADGYSLLLGSNECGKCPNNNYLSLLLVFGVAGIALVVVLILLNLTVSVGTINGLIFYANIVKMNENVFLPFGPSSPPVLRQFISFLNLDFGLKTCFVNGLTGYSKTWLQFAFPFYLWLIMISIMLLSRCFMKISKLLGNNAIKVFATLLLLSYTKIIRVIGQILSIQPIYSNNTYYSVWKYDGTIRFSNVKFIALFCFALLVMIGLVVPYTLFLISLPFIDKCFAKIRCNFLLIKPFADAYAGPFNNKYQFWIGLLLVYRLFITIIIGVSVKKEYSLYTNVVFMLMLLNLLNNIKGLYNKAYLNFLESWFLSHVLFLSVVALSSDQNIVQIGSIISVSLVMISFIGICVFHVFMKSRNRFCLKKSKDKPVSATNVDVDEDLPRVTARGKSVFSMTSYEDTELREPCLELVN